MKLRTSLIKRSRGSGGASDAIAAALATRAGMSWRPDLYATTMFTDTTATVPASAPGDVIAVQIDPSRGLTPGPELASNPGPFTATTGWTAISSSISVVGSKLRITGDGSLSFGRAWIAVSTVIGKAYRVNATSYFVSGSDNNTFIEKSDASGSNVNVVASAQSAAAAKTLLFVATATTSYIRLVSVDPSDVNDWDNISIKLLPYNYFAQSTLENRPILVRHPKRGRVNSLTYTEQFDNAVWDKLNVTIGVNASNDPNGTLTAESMARTVTGTGETRVRFATAQAVSTEHTLSAYVKAGTTGAQMALRNIAVDATDTTGVVKFNPADGSIDLTFGSTYTGKATMTSVGGGWYRCSITGTTPGTITNNLVDIGVIETGATALGGQTGDLIYIWGAQVEAAASATTYQKVVSTYDITETGQASCWGLYHDGVNDSMATAATLDLSGSDKVGVFMGCSSQSNVGFAAAVEHSATWDANTGSFVMGRTANFLFGSKGANSSLTFGPASPGQIVLCGLGDISDDRATLRVDGVQVSQSVTDQGAGNFGNYTTYKGARGGVSDHFVGIDWGGAVISGLTTTDAAIIAAIEAQIAENTPGVTF